MKAAFDSIGEHGKLAVESLGDAFGTIPNSILQGENALVNFGNNIKATFAQVAQLLLKTAAIAATLSLITNAFGGNPISFLGAFKGLLGLADGGITTRPTLAMIGEADEREAIIPLSKLN